MATVKVGKSSQSSKFINKRKRKGVGIYAQNVLTKQISLSFGNVGNNVAELLSQKLSEEFEGKCIIEGYVKPHSIRLLSWSSGEIKGENVLFTTVFECLISHPVEGQLFRCIVKNITKAGVRAETKETPSPVVVFIARDHHHNNKAFSQLNVNNEISIRVIGIRYELNDKYISVIAEYVDMNKPKVRILK